MSNSVLITGCAGGIGRALVSQFKEAGYRVIGTDVAECDGALDAFLTCDLARLAIDEGYGRAFSAQLRDALVGKQLSLLINNAAVQILGHMPEVRLADFRRTIDVNLVAPFRIAQICLEHIADKGCVLNIGSVHAVATKPGFVGYATSKAALHGLTRAMAVDFGPRCRVLCLAPAAVRTDMLMAGFEGKPDKFAELESMHPLNRLAEPSEIARFALMLATEAYFATGSTFYLDGGVLSRLHDPE